ncbi:alkaline phosphatase family protein [Vibrio intestinalis]|uniref:alkaline phosphatase family protein n=1 Tax=Vibrio intestinalis TaxID=2933291 RepID=UPI0021A65516|nr:alkaline phosphatase family protein [Vibrio intestinalis]
MNKTIFAMMVALTATPAMAHTALMACYDEGNGYITCEGGFSDGASAEGVEFRIEQNGSVVMETKLDEFGEVYFEKPKGDFTVLLNGGEGHVVHVDGRDITE